ncbi:MAG: ComEC/Rec2 family competence protein, partial [Acutalibacteraceae bacterium]|nr:ComEC/Rec2 family competence protein [Acutalibacteraceae bacterium]
MEKPMFYFGSCYLWTLMVLSLTGMGMAVGLMVATVPVCIFLIDRLRRPVQGKQKLKFFLAAGAIVLVACIAFLLQTMLVYRPALSHAGEEVSDTFLVTEVLNDSASGAHRCVVLVEGREPVRRLRLSSDTYEPRVGDVFRGTLQLKALGEQNPAVARYYKSRGLYLGATSSGRIDADPLDETEARGDVTVPPVRLAWWTLRIRLTTLRETLTGRIEEWLPPEEAGVLEGMLVGDKTDIGPDTNTAFQKAGVLHLFAVSGFHVSLWTMLVYKILLHIGAGRKTASGGTILFLFLFVALTGFPRSAVRAGIMLGVFFLSRMFVRSSEPLNALGVAVLVIVLPNPFYAGDTG